jgi:hypothetical protein
MGGGGCGVSVNVCSCAHGAQINFGDLTPYLINGVDTPAVSAEGEGRGYGAQ